MSDTLEKQVNCLRIYEKAIKHICSIRHESVDDYIRIAKQDVADYELEELKQLGNVPASFLTDDL